MAVSIKSSQKSIKESFREKYEKYPLLANAVEMGVPMCVSAFGMYLQLVLEHYATYKYVQSYALTDEAAENAEFITMYDPVSSMIKKEEMEIGIIDKLAYVPAIVFFILTVCLIKHSYVRHSSTDSYYRQTVIGVFTKVCFMWALLATLKGVFDAVTLQPDSSGWEVCKKRLTPWGVDYMRNSTHTFFPDMFILDFELLLGKAPGHTPPLRLCSDMMYSGHTFTVVVFALGINELAVLAPFKFDYKAIRPAILVLLWLCVFCHQGAEIYIVLKTRFHYTSDVVAAVFMSLLVYTNAIIPYGAKLWATRGFKGFLPMMFTFDDEERKSKPATAKPLLSQETYRDKEVKREQEDKRFISAGEILTPWICFPFCYWTGLNHVYTDRQFTSLLQQQQSDTVQMKDGTMKRTVNQQALRYCQQKMSMNDGVYLRDYLFQAPESEASTQDFFGEEKVFEKWCEKIFAKGEKKREFQMWFSQGVIPLCITATVMVLIRFSYTLATYTYVHHYMLKGSEGRDPKLQDPFHDWLEHERLIPADTDSNANNDRSHYVFDVMATIIFCLFGFLLVNKSTRPCALQVFHKVSISCWLSGILTAILVLVTAVPDSSGTKECGDVLKHSDQWNFMQQDQSLAAIFAHAIRLKSFTQPRDCGIAFGGFFQFTLIFFFGLFEWFLLFMRLHFWKVCTENQKCRALKLVKFYMMALFGLGFCYIFASYCGRYESKHLHYTMDLVMHVSLALLLYTNANVSICAKWWSQVYLQDLSAEEKDFARLNSSGDIFIPPCCFPFCCLWGRYHVYGDDQVKELYKKLYDGRRLSVEARAQLGIFRQPTHDPKMPDWGSSGCP